MAVDPNILGPIQQPTVEPIVTPVGQQQQTSHDSLQVSDEIASIAYLYSAAMPVLPPPDYANSIDLKTAVAVGITADAASKLVNAMSDLHSRVVSDMLDGWAQQLKEQATRVQEWINSSAYQQFIATRFPNEQTKNIVDTEIKLSQTRTAGVEAAANYPESSGDKAALTAGFMAGSLIIGSGLIVDFASIPNGLTPSIQTTPNIVAEAMPSFQNILVEPNLVAQLGFIAGMVAAGAVHSSVLTTILRAAQGDEKPESTKAYGDFAQRILNLVQNESFAQHILFRIVDRMPGAEKMSEAQKNQMVAVVKTILLATALAALYKGETQWLGAEVKNLLEGDLTSFFAGGSEQERNLRTQIGNELQHAYADLSPNQKERLLTALSDYFSSQPTLKQLSNIGNTFDQITERLVHKEMQG